MLVVCLGVWEVSSFLFDAWWHFLYWCIGKSMEAGNVSFPFNSVFHSYGREDCGTEKLGNRQGGKSFNVFSFSDSYRQ